MIVKGQQSYKSNWIQTYWTNYSVCKLDCKPDMPIWCMYLMCSVKRGGQHVNTHDQDISTNNESSWINNAAYLNNMVGVKLKPFIRNRRIIKAATLIKSLTLIPVLQNPLPTCITSRISNNSSNRKPKKYSTQNKIKKKTFFKLP